MLHAEEDGEPAADARRAAGRLLLAAQPARAGLRRARRPARRVRAAPRRRAAGRAVRRRAGAEGAWLVRRRRRGRLPRGRRPGVTVSRRSAGARARAWTRRSARSAGDRRNRDHARPRRPGGGSAVNAAAALGGRPCSRHGCRRRTPARAIAACRTTPCSCSTLPASRPCPRTSSRTAGARPAPACRFAHMGRGPDDDPRVFAAACGRPRRPGGGCGAASR